MQGSILMVRSLILNYPDIISSNLILSSKKLIELDTKRLKFIRSGWGEDVVDNSDVWELRYKSDDRIIEGYFARPKEVNGKIPLVIWNRGGSRKAGAIDKFLARGIYGEIASWGYTVLASQYRKNDQFGGDEINDVLNLIELANEFEECDASQIGMEGWSRGGMMTYLAMTKTDKLKCAVIISGLADLVRNSDMSADMSEVYMKLFGSSDEREFRGELERRSAVNFFREIKKDIPVLLIHGTNDTRVSYQDSVEMFSNLKSNGNEVEFISIEGGDHYLKKNRKEVNALRRNWYKKYFKN